MLQSLLPELVIYLLRFITETDQQALRRTCLELARLIDSHRVQSTTFVTKFCDMKTVWPIQFRGLSARVSWILTRADYNHSILYHENEICLKPSTEIMITIRVVNLQTLAISIKYMGGQEVVSELMFSKNKKLLNTVYKKFFKSGKRQCTVFRKLHENNDPEWIVAVDQDGKTRQLSWI